MFTRRELLASAGVAGLAGLAARPVQALSLKQLYYQSVVPEIFRDIPRPPTYTPNLVIGSGFGGAVSALRLAQAGQQVAVLERGSKWPMDSHRSIFSNDTLPDGRAFWHRTSAKMIAGITTYFDDFGGVLDTTVYDNMIVWRGAAVGGGSVVFTGVMIQPERRYFDAIFNGLVNYDEMNNIFYPRVRQMLRLSPMPAKIYNSMPHGHSRLWDQQVAKAGYKSYPVESIWNWNVVQAELSGTSKPSATIGLSNHGNSNGAKYDLNQNYLLQAEATGRAKIYPGHEVQGIGWDGSRYTVDVIKRSPDGQQLDRYVLSCDRLFLAAGSIGTSELLVRAQAQGTLHNLNAETGHGWGSNGDTIVVRSFGIPKGFVQSAPCASRIHDPSGLPVSLQNWYVPGVPVDVGIIGSLGMGFDQTHRGRFLYDASVNKVRLEWAVGGNDDVIAATGLVNNRICAAAQVVPGAWPFVEGVNGRSWTAHPLGGAVLGKVTDAYGRVKGHAGLYVMDGAMIPGSTGTVNPSLTITALAERNIQNIVQKGG
ncbi:GMC family oxidoreductase [Diaphorobacter sp. HDW4A]|uniref:GMC oxidoreductase n=1 Tax=Diaphorobacter sp. HDW4A TaxID=2714924 RepID=UPI00140E5938|nr:GMC oxidoreductase [Diaphorobacter sp. HDW4A]QIL83398.1 GMC family oxidoreductase [Diaphorobacter sp. HDW4A]